MKEIDTEGIYSKRELFNINQESTATLTKLEKNQKNAEVLAKEKEMYLSPYIP